MKSSTTALVVGVTLVTLLGIYFIQAAKKVADANKPADVSDLINQLSR